MKLVAVLIALEAVASAQPQPDVDPAPPSPSEAAPAETPPPVALPPGHDMAVRMTNAARNAAARGKCSVVDALDRRVRELDAAYYEQAFATDPTIARCRAAVAPPALTPPGLVAVAETPPPGRLGLTLEAGVGLGAAAASQADTLHGLGGPAFGIGGFVTPTVALSLRMSGALVGGDGGSGYIGVLGPNAQLWINDHVWLGGGLGLTFIVACDEGCGEASGGVGLDARVGYAFRPRGQSGANVSLETTYSQFGNGDGIDSGIATASLMIGFQSF